MLSDETPKRVYFERSGPLTIARFDCRDISSMETLDHILEDFKKELEREEFKYLLIDFQGVEFAASNAINMLLVILKRVRDNEGDVYLCSLSQTLDHIFRMMQIDKLFEIFPTRSAAVTFISKKFGW
jgi:anti-sigma B factor antagonist